MTREFEIFYGDTAEIFKVSLVSDYDAAYEKRLASTVACDVQPLGGNVSENENGLLKSCEKKMYFSSDADIVAGDYAVIEGESYIIRRVDRRSLGSVAYLEGREIFGD